MMMKRIDIKIIWMLTLLFAACSPTADTNQEAESVPRTPVQIVSPTPGSIGTTTTFLGTTTYLSRSVINASVAGFITKVNVKLGDRVQKDEVLFVLQTKEGKALQSSAATTDSLMKNFGLIEMKAPASGVVSTLDKQQPGDYIMEGTPLCTIAESSQLVFQINLPFEYAKYVAQGKSCSIRLPDGAVYKVHFIKALPAMNAIAQTQTFLAVADTELFLPENMIVTAELNTGETAKAQLLPTQCVLADEMMTQFWVMRMINDSVAVRTTVTTGHRNSEQIEILKPEFNLDDRIIAVGNYGLPDTALVEVQNNTGE